MFCRPLRQRLLRPWRSICRWRDQVHCQLERLSAQWLPRHKQTILSYVIMQTIRESYLFLRKNKFSACCHSFKHNTQSYSQRYRWPRMFTDANSSVPNKIEPTYRYRGMQCLSAKRKPGAEDPRDASGASLLPEASAGAHCQQVSVREITGVCACHRSMCFS